MFWACLETALPLDILSENLTLRPSSTCCSVSICLCQIPFINSLLRGREPGMFESKLFCGIWDAVYRKANGFYALSVLCLTISRAISITFPLYRMKKGLIIATLYIYILYWAFRFGAEFFMGFDIIYSAQCSYCFHSYYVNSENGTDDSNKSEFKALIQKFGTILPILEKCSVALLTVVSFIVVMTVLLSKSTRHQQRGDNNGEQLLPSLSLQEFFLFAHSPTLLSYLCIRPRNDLNLCCLFFRLTSRIGTYCRYVSSWPHSMLHWMW